MSKSSAKPPGVSFVHLRTHTAYSLSEGALQIKKLAELAKDAGMPAVAITDTGNLFGALEFSEAMADKGIQPIIGCTSRSTWPMRRRRGASSHSRDFAACPSLASSPRTSGLPQPDEAVAARPICRSPDNAEHHVPLGLISRSAARASSA